MASSKRSSRLAFGRSAACFTGGLSETMGLNISWSLAGGSWKAALAYCLAIYIWLTRIMGFSMVGRLACSGTDGKQRKAPGAIKPRRCFRCYAKEVLVQQSNVFRLAALVFSFFFGMVATGYYLTWLADKVASLTGYFVAISTPVAVCAFAGIIVAPLFSGKAKLAPSAVSASGALLTIGWLIITMGAEHA